MRGTVKQGGSGTGALKEESSTKSGVRRIKANNSTGVTGSIPGSSGPMVIKQEVKVEVKPDPDAAASATSPCLNGDESLKANLSTTKTANIKNETKVKVEMVNGGLHDNDIKPPISDISAVSNSTTITSSSSSPPVITPPHSADDAPKESSNSCAPNKGCGAGVATSDAQYMQQQSQIFVFTTQLANKAAEAVMQGHVLSIIAYHCSQPMTKQLLEKHPLKINQFSQGNLAQWLNSTSMKTNKTPPIKNEINTISPMSCMQGDNPMMSPSMGGPPTGGPMGQVGPPGMNMIRPNSGGPPGMVGPRGPMMMHHGSGPMPGPAGSIMDPMGAAPKSYGTKVPDSDLTPDQRMHREEQMARLRQMQAMFFPDYHSEMHNDMGTNAESSIPCTVSSGSNISGSKQTQCNAQGPQLMTSSCSGSVMSSCSGPMQNSCMPNMPGQMPPGSCGGPFPNPQMSGPCSGPLNSCSMPGSAPTPMSGPCQSGNTSIASSIPSSSSSITTTTVSMSSCSNPVSSQTNTSTSSTSVCQVQSVPHLPPCSQMTPTPNMGPSPIPGMGHSPGLGPSPNMVSSPVMGPSPGAMGPMGPVMSMPPNMMSMAGSPMGSQPNMMMGPGPNMMGNNMMMNPQNGVMGGHGMRMMGPGGPMMMGGPNSSMNNMAHMDWQRMQAEFFESKRKKGPMCPDMGMMGPMGPMGNPMMGGPMGGNMMMGHMRPMGPNNGSRMQGPPPPYHGPRPMGNGPLPSPGSPSMCPIPSPRLPNCSSNMRIPNSGLDSPRPMVYSNPTTPVSCGPIPSPSLSLKDQATTPQSMSNEPMPFGRQLQSFAQQKQQQGTVSCGMASQQGNTNGNNKEPSLMPVPSPQQIQYLNTFDGQELTIQKQPNTSLRDSEILSPLNSGIDSTGGTLEALTPVGSRVSGPATPQGGPATPHTPSSDRFTGPNTPDRFTVPSPGMVPPSTPQDPKSQRFGGPSPQGPNSNSTPNPSASNSSYSSNSIGGSKTPSLDSRFPIPSPKTPGDINNGPRYPGASPLPSDANRLSNSNGSTPTNNGTQSSQNTKIGSGFSTSPNKIASIEMGSGDFSNPAAANLPLNPNCITPSSIQASAPGKVVDPISSMAQMSQQLTSGQSGNSPPISSATTPTLAGPMGGPMGPGMMDSPGCMMGMPSVSTSPVMMGGPIASPSSALGPRCSSPGNMPNNMMNVPNPRMVGPRPPNNNGCMPPGNFGGTNIQVQPGAPNTIQYLPARAPCNSMGGPRAPPSLEFLPRFNNPGQIEKSGSPMFPNSSTPNSMCAPNVPMSSMSMSGACGPMSMPGGPMCTMSGPVGGGNMNGPYPGPNGPMGMGPNGPMSGMPTHMGPNGPMMGPNNPMGGPMMGPNGPMGMNPSMMMGGHAHMGPNGQMMGPRGGGPMMRGPSPSMMNSMATEMYNMNNPNNPNMPGGPMQSGPNPNSMMSASGPMYGPKGSPVNMGMGGPMGGAPDAAQPLPPSMGQSGNFKNPALMGPTTADPTYAAQFHNFQQQLYATNTRGPMGPMGGHVMPPHGPGGPVGGGPMVPQMPQNFPFNAK